MFPCLALRVSLTSDLARCFGRFAGTRETRQYRSCRRIRVAPFVVVVVFRYRQSRSPARSDPAFSFPVLSFRRIHLRCRVVVLCIAFSFLVPFSFSVCRVRCA